MLASISIESSSLRSLSSKISGCLKNALSSKFTFASDGGSSNVGNLTVARGYFGQSTNSTTYGYCAGGYISSALNPIDKFLFASEGNATVVGDLVNAKYSGVGWGD